jgi:hypothetical protein
MEYVKIRSENKKHTRFHSEIKGMRRFTLRARHTSTEKSSVTLIWNPHRRAGNLSCYLGLVNRYLGDALPELSNTLHAGRRRHSARLDSTGCSRKSIWNWLLTGLTNDVTHTVCSVSNCRFLYIYGIPCTYKSRHDNETPSTAPYFASVSASSYPYSQNLYYPLIHALVYQAVSLIRSSNIVIHPLHTSITYIYHHILYVSKWTFRQY